MNRDEEEDDKEIQLVTKAELETSGCIALLQQFDPNLARPYIGARDALNGNNPDPSPTLSDFSARIVDPPFKALGA